MSDRRISYEKEFETLRAELIQGRKYVFERPIIIISGSIAFIKLVDETYAIFLPIIIINLLHFNIFFTVNRMGSIARIVSYIQLIFESNTYDCPGWETALRNYRKWLSIKSIKINEVEIDKNYAHDSLGYFPVIYYMHIFTNLTVATISIVNSVVTISILNIFISIATVVSLLLFLIYAFNNSPYKIKFQIEQNRKIWIDVFLNWKKINY